MRKEPFNTTPAQRNSTDPLSDAGPVDAPGWKITRRGFVTSAGILTGTLALGVPLRGIAATSIESANSTAKGLVPLNITINGHARNVSIDSRVTLLDLLREDFGLTGTKKGCDHGQCGACTVLSNGRRINSCLSLALVHDGDKITTIEGLAEGDKLHPLQAAFLEHDGLQCGYCTPGQICSAAAVLTEHKRGDASFVTANLNTQIPTALTPDEIRERMSGNICRCGAYPGIVAAVQSVADARRREG
jgi:xanthine dehydrogenase YagT iron-sulfur-binding subunit